MNVENKENSPVRLHKRGKPSSRKEKEVVVNLFKHKKIKCKDFSVSQVTWDVNVIFLSI